MKVPSSIARRAPSEAGQHRHQRALVGRDLHDRDVAERRGALADRRPAPRPRGRRCGRRNRAAPGVSAMNFGSLTRRRPRSRLRPRSRGRRAARRRPRRTRRRPRGTSSPSSGTWRSGPGGFCVIAWACIRSSPGRVGLPSVAGRSRAISAIRSAASAATRAPSGRGRGRRRADRARATTRNPASTPGSATGWRRRVFRPRAGGVVVVIVGIHRDDADGDAGVQRVPMGHDLGIERLDDDGAAVLLHQCGDAVGQCHIAVVGTLDLANDQRPAGDLREHVAGGADVVARALITSALSCAAVWSITFPLPCAAGRGRNRGTPRPRHRQSSCTSHSNAKPCAMAVAKALAVFSTTPLARSCRPRWAIGRATT